MTKLLATLGMYDGGELAEANDDLWTEIARRLVRIGVRDVPVRLDRKRSLEDAWSSGRLLFGQTCGYPFAARFHDELRLVATPRYSADGCTNEGHRSFVVVSAKSSARDLISLRGARAVVNDETSMTGRHLFGDAIARAGGKRGFFRHVAISGSHAASLAQVACGEADVAAIDCVSWAHFARSSPEHVAATRILHRTRVTPSLPFVVSAARGEVTAQLVARALAEAMASRSTRRACRILLLEGVTRSRPTIYDRTLLVAACANRVFGVASTSVPLANSL